MFKPCLELSVDGSGKVCYYGSDEIKLASIILKDEVMEALPLVVLTELLLRKHEIVNVLPVEEDYQKLIHIEPRTSEIYIKKPDILADEVIEKHLVRLEKILKEVADVVNEKIKLAYENKLKMASEIVKKLKLFVSTKDACDMLGLQELDALKTGLGACNV